MASERSTADTLMFPWCFLRLSILFQNWIIFPAPPARRSPANRVATAARSHGAVEAAPNVHKIGGGPKTRPGKHPKNDGITIKTKEFERKYLW